MVSGRLVQAGDENVKHSTVAVSGGLGMLGALVASWLLQHRAAHLMLLGRSASRLPPGLPLASSHAAVIAMQCDVSASSDAPLLVARPFDSPAVGGLLHSGGALADATLPRQTPSAMRRAFAPKVDGAMKLRQALRGCWVGPCVLFSSVAGLMGSPGQASYSAANAALDGLAGAWAAEGSAAVAVQWGAWAGGGMAARDSGTVRRLARMGLGVIEPEVGLAALEGVLAIRSAGAPAQVALNPTNWAVLLRGQAGQTQGLQPLLRLASTSSSQDCLGSEDRQTATLALSAGPSRAGADGEAPPKEALEEVILHSCRSVIADLEIREDTLDSPLMAMGLDSLGAVELRSTLERETGVQLAATSLFDHPTIRDLAAFLHASLSASMAAKAKPPELRWPGASSCDGMKGVEDTSESSLVTGLNSSGSEVERLPSVVVAALSSRLPQPLMSSDATDCVRQPPLSRWDVETASARCSPAVRSGAFLTQEPSVFDSEIFGMHAAEALLLDPQQRLLMEGVTELMLAVRPPASGENDTTGVFLGIWPSDYVQLTSVIPKTPYHATGSSMSVASGRLSYMFSLRGPAISVDTACSASLVAVHMARTSVIGRESSRAFTAGVSIILGMEKYAALDAAGMLSISGRCRPLDTAADGYARGEAMVALLLKESDASAAPALIVSGSAVNQDGRSSSLTAPHGPSQQRVLLSAAASGGQDPADTAGYQMHGTGTALGDPIELGAITNVLKNSYDQAHIRRASKAVYLQACKSAFAHSEAAAGVIGLLCSVNIHGIGSLVGIQHLRSVNPHAQECLQDAARAHNTAVPRQPEPWVLSGEKHQAVGTSSFAYQGTNCCVITARTECGRASVPAQTNGLFWSKERQWPVHNCELAIAMSTRHLPVTPSSTRLSGRLLAAGLAGIACGARVLGRLSVPPSLTFSAISAAAELLAGGKRSSPVSISQLSLPITMTFPHTSAAEGVVMDITSSLLLGTLSLAIAGDELPTTGHHSPTDVAAAKLRHLHLPTPSDPPLHRHQQRGYLALRSRIAGGCNAPAVVTCIQALRFSSSDEDSCGTDFLAADTVTSLDAGSGWLLRITGIALAVGTAHEKSELQGTHAMGRFVAWIKGSSGDVETVRGARNVMQGITACPLSKDPSHSAEQRSRAMQRAAVSAQWCADVPATVGDNWRHAGSACEAGMMGGKRLPTAILAALQASGSAAHHVTVRFGSYNSRVGTCGGDSTCATANWTATAAVLKVAATEMASRSTACWDISEGYLSVVSDATHHLGASATRPQQQQAVGGDSDAFGSAAVSLKVDGRSRYTETLQRSSLCRPPESRLAGGLLAGGLRGRVVVVTGAAGALGSLAARWLVSDCSVGEVVMLARSPHGSGRCQVPAGGLGAPMTLLQGDVSTASDTGTEAYLSGFPLLFPVAALLHAGGVMRNASLPRHDASTMRSAAVPKERGAANFHLTFAGSPVNVALLFSSVAAAFGNGGQAGYAAANAALDAIAWDWRRAGLGGVSVQWGAWATAGMAVAYSKALERAGQGLLPPATGLAALRQVLGVCGTSRGLHLPPCMAVASMKWPGGLPAAAVPQALEEELRNAAEATPAMNASALQKSTEHPPASVPQPGRSEVSSTSPDTGDAVRRVVEEVLGVGDIDAGMPLSGVGMDSLSAIEIRNVLEEQFSLPLPATLLYDCPTLDSLAAGIAGRLASSAQQREIGGQTAIPDVRTLSSNAILHSRNLGEEISGRAGGAAAVVAEMSFLLPAARGVLADGCGTAIGLESSDCSGRVPLSRWDVEGLPASPSGAGHPPDSFRHAAFLGMDVAAFDAECFQVPPAEACAMDPQHRLLLQGCACLGQLSGHPRCTGVFCGIYPAEYADVLVTSRCQENSHFATSSSMAVAAGRVSFFFGFGGPCVSIDTACSSAAVATHLATADLKTGSCVDALAITASIILSPGKCSALIRAGMLSPAGRCKPLDSSADGYARGEAVLCVLLGAQPGTRADRSSSPSLAILCGTSVNQDGRSSSLTAPHGPSQQLAIMEACAAGGSEPGCLAAVQLHGTGTALGDPIEIGALAGLPTHGLVHLQASKSSFAHSEPSAGLVNLLCAAAMHCQAEAMETQHLRNVNPYVQPLLLPGDDEGGKRAVSRQASAARLVSDCSQPTVCSSSFAYQGTNSVLLTSSGGGNGVSACPAVLCSRCRPWATDRYWATPVKPHPVLREAAVFHDGSSRHGIVQLQGLAETPHLAAMYDHSIQGHALMPGACFMELAATAVSHIRSSSNQANGSQLAIAALLQSSIPVPMLLAKQRKPQAGTLLEVSVDTMSCRTAVCSSKPNAGGQLSHMLSSAALVASLSTGKPSTACLSRSEGKLQLVHVVGRLPLARGSKVLGMPSTASRPRQDGAVSRGWRTVHPATLDCSLQLGQLLEVGPTSPKESTFVPSGIKAFALMPLGAAAASSLPSSVSLPTQRHKRSPAAGVVLNHRIQTDRGIPVGLLEGFEARSMSLDRESRPSSVESAGQKDTSAGVRTGKHMTTFLDLQWAADLPSSPGVQHSCSRAGNAIICRAAMARGAGSDGPRVRGQCHAEESVVQRAMSCGIGGLRLTAEDSALALGWKTGPVGQAASSGGQLQLPSLWGLVQTVGNESRGQIGLSAKAVSRRSTSGGPGGVAGTRFMVEACSSNTEPAMVTCSGVWHSVTLRPRRARSPLAEVPHQLEPSSRGTLDCLRPRRVSTANLGAGQVCIRVEAVGINFRDVLNVLDMYPGDPGLPGTDLAGVVVATGDGVTNVVPGDSVIGLSPGCLGSHVIASHETVSPIPAGLSLTAAAATPTVHVTVDMALRAAGLEKGRTVLVHAAAGGVGLAAVTAASAAGLHVMATAGSATKRSMLRRMGVKSVYDSRGTAFIEGCALGSPAGVDMVLNSLTSPGMVAASLAVLARGGSLIELSKRDIWGPARSSAERRDVQLHLLALDFLPTSQLQCSLRRVARLLGNGKIPALPTISHRMGSIQAALRQLSQVRGTVCHHPPLPCFRFCSTVV